MRHSTEGLRLLPSADKTAASTLSIEVTTRCTSACKHCFARAGLRGDASLEGALAKRICKEGYATGFRHLHLTGGEPLLWKGLYRLLDEAFGMGYQSVFLNTNGLLLTREAAEALSRYPALGVSISLQGPEALHDAVRGAGSFRRTSEGIDQALGAGLAVTIFSTIGKTLLAMLPSFAMGLQERFKGLQRLTLIQVIRVRDDIHDLSRELLDPEDIQQLAQLVSALNLFGVTTDVLRNPLVNVAAEMLKLPAVPPSGPRCPFGKLIVRANRDISLFHSTWESFGRYAPGMIRKVLASHRYRARVAGDATTCPDCRFFHLCRKMGLWQPSAGIMDMVQGLPFCQRALRHIEAGGRPAVSA